MPSGRDWPSRPAECRLRRRADRDRRRDPIPRVLALGGQLLRLRLHVERARDDPPGTPRGRARVHRDARRAGPGRDGGDEHPGDGASGWICDRFGPKGPLAVYYAVRGFRSCSCPMSGMPTLYIFAAIFGLNYISTAPATTTLTATIFGRYWWARSRAGSSSRIRSARRSARRSAAGFQRHPLLHLGVLLRGRLAFLAAAMALAIKEEPVNRTPSKTVAPAGLPATAG